MENLRILLHWCGVLIFILKIATANIVCPDGSILNTGQCYKILSSPRKNWNEAQNYCRTDYKDLIVIKSSAVYNSIKSETGSAGSLWVGALKHEGNWQWVDGTSCSSNDYWASNEPNNHGGNEGCAELHSGGLNDIECRNEYGFVCELYVVVDLSDYHAENESLLSLAAIVPLNPLSR